ncbi:MAG: protein-glutamate O-methyltransferase CheR [Pseudomonadota bacterium]
MTLSTNGLAAFRAIMLRNAGIQVGADKAYLLTTRLTPLMRREGCRTLDDLVRRAAEPLRTMVLEREIVEAMLNHESYFFRDQAAFAELGGPILAQRRSARAAKKSLRIWSAACSTGQEAYSVAMLLDEARETWSDWTVEILATDLSHGAVRRAERGHYSQFEVQRGLSVKRLLRYFEKDGEDWRLTDRIRSAVRFHTQNLCAPPPPGEFDVILARNVLMYMAPASKRAALEGLHRALAPDGFLILGASETILDHDDLFVADRRGQSRYIPVPRRTSAATRAMSSPDSRRTAGHHLREPLRARAAGR